MLFIRMALIGHHLQPHHVLRASLGSQAGQGQAYLMLGFGRQELLERLEFRSWFFPGAQLQSSGCQGCLAQRSQGPDHWNSFELPFTRPWVLNPVGLATFQVE